jgi:hypothetical protein
MLQAERTLWTPPAHLGPDFAERFAIAERLKTDLRTKYARGVHQAGRESRERFLSRSRAHWAEYEEINREWIPEDPSYNVNAQGAVLVVGNDLITYTSAASGQARFLEAYIGGEATSSTVLRIYMSLSTAGTTPAATTSWEKLNTRSANLAGTVATQQGVTAAWTAQPTITNAAKAKFLMAFNAFGGFDRWVPQPGIEVYLVNGEQCSWRPLAGTPTVSAYLVVEEL